MPGPQPERESRFPQFLHAYTKYYSWTENDLNFLDEKISDEVNSSFSSFHSPSLLAHAHYRLYLAPRRLSVGKKTLPSCPHCWGAAGYGTWLMHKACNRTFPHTCRLQELRWESQMDSRDMTVQHHRPPEAFYLHFLFGLSPPPTISSFSDTIWMKNILEAVLCPFFMYGWTSQES